MAHSFTRPPAPHANAAGFARFAQLTTRRNWKRELETLLEMVPSNDPVLGSLVSQLEAHLSTSVEAANTDSLDY